MFDIFHFYFRIYYCSLFFFSDATDRILLHNASQYRPTPISQWSEAERVLIPGSKPVRHGWCDGARVKNNKLRRGALYECEIRERTKRGLYWRITCGRDQQIVCSISGRQFSAVYIRLSIERRHHSLPITICNGRRKTLAHGQSVQCRLPACAV